VGRLDDDDLRQFGESGYVVVPSVVPDKLLNLNPPTDLRVGGLMAPLHAHRG